MHLLSVELTLLPLLLQICQGIQALHKCSPPLAHRDIKPHNVLLQRHKQHDSEAAVPIGNQSHPGDDLEAQPLHAIGAEPPGMCNFSLVSSSANTPHINQF